jgi:hypothetical protein
MYHQICGGLIPLSDSLTVALFKPLSPEKVISDVHGNDGRDTLAQDNGNQELTVSKLFLPSFVKNLKDVCWSR